MAAHYDHLRIFDAFQANIAHAALVPHLKDDVSPDKFLLLK